MSARAGLEGRHVFAAERLARRGLSSPARPKAEGRGPSNRVGPKLAGTPKSAWRATIATAPQSGVSPPASFTGSPSPRIKSGGRLSRLRRSPGMTGAGSAAGAPSLAPSTMLRMVPLPRERGRIRAPALDSAPCHNPSPSSTGLRFAERVSLSSPSRERRARRPAEVGAPSFAPSTALRAVPLPRERGRITGASRPPASVTGSPSPRIKSGGRLSRLRRSPGMTGRGGSAGGAA
jgi:hypothetical protein